jgi:protein KTI12
MPLLTVCGPPLSGKTTAVQQLVDLLSPIIDVHVVSHEFSVNDEKNHRKAVLSATERELTKNRLVIVDDMNFIKGFMF